MAKNKGQWQKGQSGNPRGRPKGRRDSWAKIGRILSDEVQITRPDGRRESVDWLVYSFLATCKKALRGNKTPLFRALDIMETVTPPDEFDEENNWEPGSQKELIEDLSKTFPILKLPLPKSLAPVDAVALQLYVEKIEAELDAEKAEAPSEH